MIPGIRSIGAVYLVAVTLTMLSMSVPSSLAQVAGGTLTGTITDRTGSEIPNAQIVIKDLATGIDRTVTTNKDGFYIAANLLPAEYQVTISAAGFNTEVKSRIKINV